jgi:hypothetical protein
MQIAPYVSDRKKKRQRMRAYLFTAAGILALYIIFFTVQWFIFHSPIFRVDSVVVKGNNVVASADIISLAEASAFPGDHPLRASLTFKNMILWPDAIPQKELQLIPQLASVSVSKDLFSHMITITVTERTPFGVWCFSARPTAAPVVATSSVVATSVMDLGASCVWFDDTGTIFARAGDTQGSIIFVTYDRSQSLRGLNQKVLPEEFLQNFISVMDVLRGSGLGVRAIELNDLSLQEVDVSTTNGPTIYFSLQFPADEYLKVIQKFMLQSKFDTLQYIDCRTEHRVFYK